jgi:two-component system, NarL family, response regulator DesR
MIRILIAEDEQLIRDALVTLLSLEADLDVVAQTGRGDNVVDLIENRGCDVAVVDIDMPGMNGLVAAEQVHQARPGFPLIIITSHGRPGYLRRAVQAGVRGFLTKDAPGEKLADVVRTVHGGGRYIDPELAADALAVGECPLTARELDLLRLAEDGRPLAAIAVDVSLSEGTVRNYMSAAMAKLGVDNKVAAARLARRMGWL